MAEKKARRPDGSTPPAAPRVLAEAVTARGRALSAWEKRLVAVGVPPSRLRKARRSRDPPTTEQLDRIERLCGDGVRRALENIRESHPNECRDLAGVVEHLAYVFRVFQGERQAEKLGVTIPTVPWFAAVPRNATGRCEECGNPISGRRKDALYCSDECANRKRNRGRNTITAAARRHFDTCRECRAGRLCSRGEALISSKSSKLDAFSRRRVEYRER